MRLVIALSLLASFVPSQDGGVVARSAKAASTAVPAAVNAPSVSPPPGYVIGPDDQLTVMFWRDKDLSADVIVRPDGKISLPLLNDVQAAGLTPDQLREEVTRAAKRFMEDPQATVVVRAINSRKVFITGSVAKPGTFPLIGDMTVMQLIALGGGLSEYAKSKSIKILRNENGRQMTFTFNYKDVTRQKHVEQNILLKPGDTVIVP